jgi:hypothetical protein
MMSEIQAGDGWRLLGPDEYVRALDDEFFEYDSKSWKQVSPQFNLNAAWNFNAVRRRIPAKPEAISMMDYSGIIAVTAMPETVTIEQVFPGEESDFVVIETVQNVRQLADWLTRFADWREAQEGGGV